MGVSDVQNIKEIDRDWRVTYAAGVGISLLQGAK
jgi:hypothetical protein